MKKVFVDTNVLLDLLLERETWAQDAARLFSMADRREVELLCSSRIPVLTPQKFIQQ